jgi:L-cystine uptake protein TcyP (sodium:dicarboxylate symporter family)
MTLWLVPLLPIVAGAIIAAMGDLPRAWLGTISVAVLGGTLILALLAVVIGLYPHPVLDLLGAGMPGIAP